MQLFLKKEKENIHAKEKKRHFIFVFRRKGKMSGCVMEFV
jgi:hypothetical protein